MSLPPRFYLPSLGEGEQVLDGPEAHHLLNVRRLNVGATVELFDGAGRFAAADVIKTTRSEVRLSVSSVQTEPELSRQIVIASPLPKPDRARWMVEKLAELGVAELCPLITKYSVSSGKPIKREKLTQYVVDACKQSRRNVLMRVAEPMKLPEFVTQANGALLLADQAGEPIVADKTVDSDVSILIGPEGGFAAEERESIVAAGATAIAFGQHILRVETAAIAAAVLLTRRSR